jgi:hypothetical protein
MTARSQQLMRPGRPKRLTSSAPGATALRLWPEAPCSMPASSIPCRHPGCSLLSRSAASRAALGTVPPRVLDLSEQQPPCAAQFLVAIKLIPPLAAFLPNHAKVSGLLAHRDLILLEPGILVLQCPAVLCEGANHAIRGTGWKLGFDLHCDGHPGVQQTGEVLYD